MTDFIAPEGLPGPHWHEQNPWKDQLIYVPIEELAACHIRLHPPFSNWDMVDAIAHWVQYGDKLDAYILVNWPVFTAGVRFGPEGHHYLSPGFSLPKLWELLWKYRSLVPAAVAREGVLP